MSSIEARREHRRPHVRRRRRLGVGRRRGDGGQDRPDDGRDEDVQARPRRIGVAVRNGVLAVSVQPAGEDVTAGSERPRRLRRAEGERPRLDTRPTRSASQSFNADQVQFHYATCAKLFNYPDASGAAGKRLVPEVAAGWPKVTDGGRTYTFRIRPGYGFSPPSHEAVTAESFRHEIERFLSRSPGRGAFEPARRRRRREGVTARARRRTSPASPPTATRW